MILSSGVSCGLAALIPAFITLVSAQLEPNAGIRVPKQATARNGLQDQNSAETGFGGGGGGNIENSKYFHYQHLPEHDKYEFGYRRGNDHHVKERYEKAVPHEGHFKTKVRWADHKGGHGEHYWDYNHAGNGDDGEGGYSDPIPAYTDSQNANSAPSPRVHQKRQSENDASRRAFQAGPTAALPPQSAGSDAEGFVKAFEDEIGGVQNFDYQREGSNKQKRAPQDQISQQKNRQQQPVAKSSTEAQKTAAQKAGREIQQNGAPQLVFDLESGKVIDENTGKTYLLQPSGN